MSGGQEHYTQQMAAETVKVTRNVGRTVGCIVAVVLVFVVLGTLIPVVIGMVSLGAGLSAILPSTRSAPPTLPAALETVFPGVLSVSGASEAGEAYATPVLIFGEQGSGPGLFDDPRAITVARDGTIYVADFSDGRIQTYDTQGIFSQLINVGEDHYIQDLAVSGDGKLYAVYGGEAWIYDAQTGAPLGQFEYPENHYFDSLAIAADGKLVFVSDGEDILVFNQDGSLGLSIPEAISSVSGDSELDTKVAVDGLGNIYALASFNNAVFKYSPQGQFLNRFGGDGDGPGKFQAVDAIDVDGHGRVFVSDIWGVQVFDSDGAYLDRFGSTADMGVVFGMAFDLQNFLYTATNKPEVVKFEVDRP
jgi:DNA-binding beta-propeller fold protein YncE